VSLTPRPLVNVPQPGDKLLHASAYCLLMLWFAQLYVDRSVRCWLAVGFLTVGMTLELMQALGSGRNFQVVDLFANAFGVAVGWLGAPPRLPNFLGWIEAMYLRR
jgi:hypothetical protein